MESQRWGRGLIFALVVWLAMMFLVTPVVGGGLFGLSLPRGGGGYAVATFASLAAYGITLVHLHYIALTRVGGPHSLGRREFMQRAAFFAVMAGATGFTVRAIVKGVGSISPSRVFHDSGMLPAEVTPNDEFYEVSKNIINPRVDVSTWKLELIGDFGNPFTLTYDELLAMPWKEEYVTLTCISNRIGGGLINNALWRGVPLKLLLERAQMPESVKRIAFRADDGYVDSFPVEYAMRENVLVAYMMNGEPLPDGHGFPARIIVPGLYGMEHVKWLTKIETVESNFRGYWQLRGWADTAVIKTMSRVDLPSDGAIVPKEETLLGGVAFAGDRGIREVEVRFVEGFTWQPAGMSEALSPYTLVLWSATWLPNTLERYPITVRATDGMGEAQTVVIQPSQPDGATGHHGIFVKVMERVESAAAG
jgi:DMSO/TMAO reductase YedYZ molybdopterin-dependent catalytic subunit